MTAPLLKINNLCIDYLNDKKPVSVVRNVNLSLNPGETLGLVGESGCGKTTLALSIMGLLPKEESRIDHGSIEFHGDDLVSVSQEKWQTIRGDKIAMVFQDPFSSLNPVLTVDYQLQEIIQLEEGKPNPKRAVALLKQVQLPDPERILGSYPHQLSGGQRQRVLIAMALLRKPEILIADEPTTALDVTIQDEIVTLLKDLQKTYQMAMIFVTHNIGLVKEVSKTISVMYAGQIIEYGTTSHVLNQPKHPYTEGLLRCIPRLKKSKGPIPVLEGQPPEPAQVPAGCPFHPRCSKIFEPCSTEDPHDRSVDSATVRCHLYDA